ncbi:MAG: hypothetical protein IIA60_01705 [Candidatus Marinimicrobia bacterium]|nr:hypothetical protein [Candidatus Neomarinimicrobiota bacterium]
MGQINDLHQNEDYYNRISFTRRQALIRELYYLEIRGQSIPSQSEIEDALQKSLQKLTIGILLTQEHGIANEWGKLKRAGRTYEEIKDVYDGNIYVQDSVLSFHWGDSNVPREIQKIAYETTVGEISDIFEVPFGFGMLSVRKRITDIFINTYAHNQDRQVISKIIQARKEDIFASVYTEKLLKNIKVEQIGSGFKEVSGYLATRAKLNNEEEGGGRYVKDIELQSNKLYDLSLVTIKSPDFEWNGYDVLSLLKQYNYSVDADGIESINKPLSVFLKSVVRDHYLAERAEHLGMASAVRVRNDIEMWSRYYLYLEGVKQMIKDDKYKVEKRMISEEIDKMRSRANIVINHELVKTITVTEIPMLVFWNTDISKNLAVPPLIRF